MDKIIFPKNFRKIGYFYNSFFSIKSKTVYLFFSRRLFKTASIIFVNTIFYIYISVKGHLFGEASVNLYYTVMSIYGWILWAKKDEQKHEAALHITYSSRKEWVEQLVFFSVFYIIIFASLSWAKQAFAPEAIPWADAFASATAYTAMWLMTKKKVESWTWWFATNLASIPLYFVKGYVFTSVQFVVLFAINIAGVIEWRRKAGERISNIEQGILNDEVR